MARFYRIYSVQYKYTYNPWKKYPISSVRKQIHVSEYVNGKGAQESIPPAFVAWRAGTKTSCSSGGIDSWAPLQIRALSRIMQGKTWVKLLY
jgi:hypothetical protein